MRGQRRGVVTPPRKGKTRSRRGRPPKSEGLGWAARCARMIAQQIAEELRGMKLDGPHARKAIFDAALLCPLVRTEKQAQAVIDGWEGRFYVSATNPNHAVCRAAGRQLAVMHGVLS